MKCKCKVATIKLIIRTQHNTHLRLSLTVCVDIPWLMTAFMIPKTPRQMPGSCTRARERRPSAAITKRTSSLTTVSFTSEMFPLFILVFSVVPKISKNHLK